MTKLNTTALIAERIRYWRERSGKNLDEVVAATGLALEVVKGYEEGHRPVPPGVLKKLSEIYQVHPNEMVWFSDDAPLPRSIASKP